MTHTPGPWDYKSKDGRYLGDKSNFNVDYDGKFRVITSLPIMKGAKTIALAVNKSNNYGDDGEVVANACLIKSAPDLLGILEEYLILGAGNCKISKEHFDKAHKIALEARGLK